MRARWPAGATASGKPDGVEVIRSRHVIAGYIGDAELVARYLRTDDQIKVPGRSWCPRNAGGLVGTVVSASGYIYGAIVNSADRPMRRWRHKAANA
jgi:hypothetical protein